jgi:hypothetical protein
MTSTVPTPRVARRPAPRSRTGTTTPAPRTILVISARGDTRGAQAAEAYAALLRGADPGTTPVVASHAGAPDLAEHIASAERLYVLDPGRLHAWQERRRARADGRHRALAAPARAADRLALLRLLRDHQAHTRWISRAQQLPTTCSAG